MDGYTTLTEFFSDDKKKIASVLKDNSSSYMYKVTFKDINFPNSILFKFFKDQQKAENEAEEWVLKNE